MQNDIVCHEIVRRPSYWSNIFSTQIFQELLTVRRPFVGRPVPRQLMRNELFDLTTIVPATAYHRRSYAERYSRFMLSGHKWPTR